MHRLALALALVAAPAFAQDAVTLTPGHPDLSVPAAPPASGTVEVRMIEPEAQRLGTVTQDVRLDGDVLTMVTTTSVQMAGPTTVDSTRLTWPSLTPLSNDLTKNGAANTVTFGDGTVAGSFDGGLGALPFDFDLEAPVFPASVLPLLLVSLPFEPGYTAVVPTFSAESRFQEARFTVVGEEAIEHDGETVTAVVVEQMGGGGLTGRFPQRHFIDPDSRELLYTDMSPQPSMLIRLVPMTAEQAAAREAEMAAEAAAAETAAAEAAQLRPGDATLATDALRDHSDAFTLRLLEPQQMDAGSETRTVTVDEAAGTVTIESVTDITIAGQRQESTLVLSYPSLAPISVVQNDGSDETSLTFADGRVTGTGDGEAVDVALDAPIFANASIVEVVRFLPFEDGYEAVFHGYSSSEGVVTTLLSVTGAEPLGDRTAWTVTADREGSPTITFKIDAETRDLISYGLSPQPGVVLEFGPAE